MVDKVCDSRRPSRGFTKLELLVGLVCLVVLLALLMPSLGSKSDSRRVQCASRLGELVKAFQQFELAKQQYPGYLNAFALDHEGVVKVGTWAVTVLPYIEQEPVYDLWSDVSTTGPWNRRGGGTSAANDEYFPKLLGFICPADTNTGELRAPNSFAVNAGFFPQPLPPDYNELNPHEIVRRSSGPPNSVFSNQLPQQMLSVYTKNETRRILGSRADAPTCRSDIHDGLTMTLAIAESVHADAWSQVGPDFGWDTVEIGGVIYAGDDVNSKWSPRVRVGIVWQYKTQSSITPASQSAATNIVGTTQTGNTFKRSFSPELARPGSHHPGIFNAGMLGGSVSTISKDIDYQVLQAMMTPHDAASDMPKHARP